jgi:hypothetical protein
MYTISPISMSDNPALDWRKINELVAAVNAISAAMVAKRTLRIEDRIENTSQGSNPGP